MIEVVVSDRLQADVRGLPDEVIAELKAVFTHRNPQWHKLKAMGLPAWSEPAEYKTWRGGPGVLSVPRGGTARLREILAPHGGVRFVDRRMAPPAEMPAIDISLRDYQEDASSVIVARENCIARLPTGAGKTVLAIAAACRLNTPALFVVQNGALFQQWIDKLEFFGVRRRDIGSIRGGKVKLAPLTIGMAQSLWKLKPEHRDLVRGYFGSFWQDEVHRCSARTFMEVADWMPARYRFGLSADHRRKDRKEFLIHDVFGQVAYEITPEELEEVGAIIDVEVRVHLTELQADWYRSEDRQAMHRLLEQITWDDARTAKVADLVASEVAAGHQVLVFSHRVEHCQRLRAAIVHRGVPCGLMIGGPENASALDEAVQAMKKGELRAAVGTIEAIGTGLDLPTISRGVVATPFASNKQQWGQVRGRLARPGDGSKESVIHYFHDESPLDVLPVRMLARWNRTVDVVEGGMMRSARDWIRDRAPRDKILEGLAAAAAARKGRSDATTTES